MSGIFMLKNQPLIFPVLSSALHPTLDFKIPIHQINNVEIQPAPFLLSYKYD